MIDHARLSSLRQEYDKVNRDVLEFSSLFYPARAEDLRVQHDYQTWLDKLINRRVNIQLEIDKIYFNRYESNSPITWFSFWLHAHICTDHVSQQQNPQFMVGKCHWNFEHRENITRLTTKGRYLLAAEAIMNNVVDWKLVELLMRSPVSVPESSCQNYLNRARDILSRLNDNTFLESIMAANPFN